MSKDIKTYLDKGEFTFISLTKFLQGSKPLGTVVFGEKSFNVIFYGAKETQVVEIIRLVPILEKEIPENNRAIRTVVFGNPIYEEIEPTEERQTLKTEYSREAAIKILGEPTEEYSNECHEVFEWDTPQYLVLIAPSYDGPDKFNGGDMFVFCKCNKNR